MMTRKVRHPYQILEAFEMAVGERYAFVNLHKGGNCFVSIYAMGGAFADTCAVARRRGHYLDSYDDDPQIEMLVAGAPGGPVVTVHMDGWWYGSDRPHAPTLAYWRYCVGSSRALSSHSADIGWDMMSTYLGPVDPTEQWPPGAHAIVVPLARWEDDPRLHAADWDNPDAVVERAVEMESAAGWERRMRARAHAAMARALGF